MTDQETGGELVLTDVRKSYDGARGVESVDLHVRPGEFLTMLGPSGSGKTTTLNLVAGFLEPDHGSITLDGQELAGRPAHQRGLGVVFQNYALFPHMTAAENVAYPLRVRGVGREEQRRRVREALGLVRLEDYADRRPAALSGGQQQRVALARAFVFNPRLLLMDEPLGALDKKLREHLQVEISRICRELGATVVYVTHDQGEALAMSDNIAIYHEGRIEQVGPAEELYRRPSSLFVADFVGESTVLHGVFDGSGVRYGEESFAGEKVGDLPAEGADVALVVRPEHVRLVPEHAPQASTPATSRLSAQVVDWVYLGEARKCLLRDARGTVVTARLPADHDMSGLTPGSTVLAEWDRSRAVVVTDPASS